MKHWLAERLQALLPQLAVLGTAQEQEIERLCVQEIAAWRARPQMKKASSLRVPMTDTCNAISQLELTEANRWRNPRTRDWEHIALKYMNFTEEEWAAMNAPSAEDFSQRVHAQQLLDHPWEILQRAEQLLTSAQWEELVVGLAVVTGRRLTEVLKTGTLHPKSAWTVVFSGQLKRRDILLDPYEIPTLVPAEQVLAAWTQVRAQVDCGTMETREVSAAYSQQVGDVARRAFHGLVPVRTNDEDLYTHLFRTVYARLAVWLYCPPQVMDLTYMATIQGHYWVLNADTEEKRLNYQSTLHYNDYKVGDGRGNIDGRQGIRLGEPGVQVLEAFQTMPPSHTKQEQKPMTLLPLRGKSHTGYGLLKPKQPTKTRFQEVQGARSQDETLSQLLDEHALYAQIHTLVQPVAAQVGTDHPLETVQALVEEFARKQSASQAFEQRWKVSLDEVGALFAQVALLDDSRSPVVVLTELVNRATQYREKYSQRRQKTRFDLMPYSALQARKEPEVVEEKVRRAVAATMRYNEQCEDPELRWYINQSLVHTLTGSRQDAIKEALAAHQEEIEEHHAALQITSAMNNKGRPLMKERILIPEAPRVSEGDAGFSLGVAKGTD